MKCRGYNIYLISAPNCHSKDSEMKNAIVKIDTNSRHDILINWNFNGLLMPKIFRRHVFLCSSENEPVFVKTHSLLQKCFQFFKNGDLYLMTAFNSSQLDWHEKSKIQNVHFPRCCEKNMYLQYKIDLKGFSKILSSLSKFRQPTFVVIYNDGDGNIQQIEGVIMEVRQRKKLNCVFMICSSVHKESIVDFSKGICYLGVDETQISAFYKYYDEHLACLQAEITLQSLSGNVYMKGNAWNSVQFSVLNRKIYYPLASYLLDIIETQRLASEKRDKWKFKLQLRYKLLNGDQFTARKELQISLVPDIQKFRTYIRNAQKNKKYQLCWGIELGQNPFEKQFILSPGI